MFTSRPNYIFQWNAVNDFFAGPVKNLLFFAYERVYGKSWATFIGDASWPQDRGRQDLFKQNIEMYPRDGQVVWDAQLLCKLLRRDWKRLFDGPPERATIGRLSLVQAIRNVVGHVDGGAPDLTDRHLARALDSIGTLLENIAVAAARGPAGKDSEKLQAELHNSAAAAFSSRDQVEARFPRKTEACSENPRKAAETRATDRTTGSYEQRSGFGNDNAGSSAGKPHSVATACGPGRATVYFPVVHGNEENGGSLNSVTCELHDGPSRDITVTGAVNCKACSDAILEARFGERKARSYKKGVVVSWLSSNFEENSYQLALAIADKLARFGRGEKRPNVIYATGEILPDGKGQVGKIGGLLEKLKIVIADRRAGMFLYPAANVPRRGTSDAAEYDRLVKVASKRGVDCAGVDSVEEAKQLWGNGEPSRRPLAWLAAGTIVALLTVGGMVAIDRYMFFDSVRESPTANPPNDLETKSLGSKSTSSDEGVPGEKQPRESPSYSKTTRALRPKATAQAAQETVETTRLKPLDDTVVSNPTYDIWNDSVVLDPAADTSTVPHLEDHGRLTRGWLGILMQPVDEKVAKAFNLPAVKGALVARVFNDSPAAEAGVKIGDVIVRFDGKEVGQPSELASIVAKTPINKGVALVVLRDGKRKKLSGIVFKEASPSSRPATHSERRTVTSLAASGTETQRNQVERVYGLSLIGEWEAQIANNFYHMRVTWNVDRNRYEGVLTRQGRGSRDMGFYVGELVWIATPTEAPGVMREAQKWRWRGNRFSTKYEWRNGSVYLDRSSQNALVTSTATFHRSG